MKRRRAKHPCGSFVRIVRTTRGTRPLPLDPLPSSLCSVVENCILVTYTITHHHCLESEERKSPWRDNGSGNP